MKKYLLIFCCLLWGTTNTLVAQFYNGYTEEFGKNRIQYDQFEWSQIASKRYSVYFYQGGQTNAEYVASLAEEVIVNLEERFDYYLNDKVDFVIYNNQGDFRQTNAEGIDGSFKGAKRIRDSRVFVYFDGDHENLKKQMEAGVADILINRLMLGKTWMEIQKNNALLTVPDWYIKGLVSYVSDPNNTETEDHIRDGVVTGKYHEFNRLPDDETIYAGHAIWSYIGKTYGDKVIPNILYMSRLSRNVESGFLYVIGLSIKSLNKEAIAYYKELYRDQEKNGNFPSEDIGVKVNKKRRYNELKISPDGKYVAYVENETGRSKVKIHEFSTGKTTNVLSMGKKTEWMPDYEYPILQWHPNSSSLAIVSEKRSENIITFYTIDDKDKISKPLLKFDRVLSTTYSPDGKSMIMSAVRNGQTDLYSYKVVSNSQKQLTDDIYDDLYPEFLSPTKILFSSNRIDDTLRSTRNTQHVSETFDLYLFDLMSRDNVLKRVTNTPKTNELVPLRKDSGFVYLSDIGQTTGRNIAYFDSVISHIDTAFHYRYVTVSEPMANYSRNIIEHSISTEQDKMVQLFYKDGKYFMSYSSIIGGKVFTPDEKESGENKSGDNTIKQMQSIPYELSPVNQATPRQVDYNNYTFSNEEQVPQLSQPKVEPVQVEKEDEAVTPGQDSLKTNEGNVGEVVVKSFRVPPSSSYVPKFSALGLKLKFDFNYHSNMYQRYLGNYDIQNPEIRYSYLNPVIALKPTVQISDVFNDNDILVGMRLPIAFPVEDWIWWEPLLKLRTSEYFLEYRMKGKRLNKVFAIERQVNKFKTGSLKYKLEATQAQLRLSYPFNERMRVQAHGGIRYDRFTSLSTDDSSVDDPTLSEGLANIAVSIVYDKTKSLGVNLYKGTRYKLFAETYNSIFTGKYTEGTSTGDSSIIDPTFSYVPSTIILGLDYRKYIKVHRQMIWANRVVASTSLGEQKLLYYLGGVENKVHITENPRFNYGLPVVDGQSYAFQTVGMNVRGFLQNTRNGNNMVMISSELRWPIFTYFATKPIKSDFVKNFQTVLFTDVGTAWTGRNPYSDDNYFNTTVVGGEEGDPVKVILRNQDEPIIAGYGFGVRSRFLGYFIKFDIAWGLEDGRINTPKSYLSIGLDF